ncbi:MAG: hypothetical protein ACOYK9_05700 [Chlamydiia bacterium]
MNTSAHNISVLSASAPVHASYSEDLPNSEVIGIIQVTTAKEEVGKSLDQLSRVEFYQLFDQNSLSNKSLIPSTKQMKENSTYMKGFTELMSALTENTISTVKNGQQLQQFITNNVSKSADLMGENVKDTRKANQEYSDALNETKKPNLAITIFSWVMAALVCAATLGTATPVVAALTITVTVAAQVITSVPVKDGKTALDLFAESPGMDKTKATLILDAMVIVLSVGAGVGAAAQKASAVVAETAAQSAGRVALSQAAKQGGQEAAKELGEGLAKNVISKAAKTSAQDAGIEMVSMSAKTVGKTAVSAVAEDAAAEATKQAIKKAAKKAEEEAEKKLVQEITKEVAEGSAKSAASKAMTKASLEGTKEALKAGLTGMDELVKKGVISGLKMGVQQSLAYFNPIGPIVSDIEYGIKVKDSMTDQEKKDLRADCDMHGQIAAMATSFAYMFAGIKAKDLTGMQFFLRDTALKHAATIQKVILGAQGLVTVGQGISAGILAAMLFKAADSLKDIGELKEENQKVTFALDSLDNLRKSIQQNTSDAADEAYSLYNTMIQASKDLYSIK